ncbi:SMP-30/gluconolactonase/LRE family protein [Amycolatopsis thermalba]|uniref:SMP-30/gluconolactonase/LRE family protein n=1 Tax=Amycolatopsis thermalba TaxID=944492 RepID=A0ABY4NU83_9PSEU|nr:MULTISPECIES: SMP-30/gluconolactonase/LRE family protein [Amycolatopsis]UQS23603.1 SMP-30/gluconolactonase/LRE family protein [Amycolatopsis thermalba]
MREIASGLRFPEGPVALDDGSVLVVEIERGTVSRVWPDGSVTVVADCGGGPNGAAIGPDGAVYVCNNGGFAWHHRGGVTLPGDQPPDYRGGCVQRVSWDGAVTELYTSVDGRSLRGPNDLVFDAHGGFYFTDLGKHRPRESDRGGLYYARADGSRVAEIAYGFTGLNGVGLSPDGSRVYAAETVTGRVWFWNVDGPGRISRPPGGVHGPAGAALLHGFGGYQMLDSLAVDSAGNVCVATLMTGGISVLSPAGELLEVVRPPEPDRFVTNICFGGPGLRTAYITSSGAGKLYATEWPRPGLRLNYADAAPTGS